MKLKHEQAERGVSTLEAAFVLVLIVLPLMFGVMDFSRAMYAYHFTAHAAREASRWASVRGTNCVAPMTNCDFTTSAPVQTFVQGILAPGIYATGCSGTTPGSLCATATWSGKAADGTTDCTSGGAFTAQYPGCMVQVQVTYYYGFTLPFLSQLNAIKMSSISQMTITQ